MDEGMDKLILGVGFAPCISRWQLESGIKMRIWWLNIFLCKLINQIRFESFDLF